MRKVKHNIESVRDEKRIELLASIIKLWIIISVLISAVLIFNNKVFAFTTGTPVMSYSNYDCDLYLPLDGTGKTSESMIFKNVNLTGYTEYIIPNFVYVPKCSSCGMDFYPYQNEMYLIINDAVQYNNNYMYSDDPISSPHYDERVFPVYSRGDMSNATVEIRFLMSTVACQYCHTVMPATYYCKGVHLYGRRGSAVMKESSVSTTVGGNVTLSPTYDGDTDHVVWGIRYPGESGFTPLNEGNNKNGLIASGTTNGSVSISNVPYVPGGFDIGVFVYTKDGELPGGTTYPDTPFFTHITVADNKAPTISVTKKVNPEGGPVLVTINANDEGGLHSEPYSFDGGKTFGANPQKSFDTAGVYQAVVRDAAGNTSSEKFYIDSIDLKTASGTSGGGTDVSDKNQGTGKGTNSGSGTSGTTSGSGGQNLGGGNNGTTTPGTSSLDNNKGGVEDSVKGGSVSKTSGNEDVKNKTEGKGNGKGGTLNGNNGGTSDLNPSDPDGEDTFEKIKENSEEYIISMQENYSEESEDEQAASVNMQEIQDMDLEAYNNELKENVGDYTPPYLKSSPLTYFLFILLFLILLAILLFILFFGVLIFADKENDILSESGKGGMRIPVAISFVTYRDKMFSICLRELFDKYDVLYLRPGILFVQMFEGEKISITTKFKGDKKREIAVETLHTEIKAGTKKQKSKNSIKL